MLKLLTTSHQVLAFYVLNENKYVKDLTKIQKLTLIKQAFNFAWQCYCYYLKTANPQLLLQKFNCELKYVNLQHDNVEKLVKASLVYSPKECQIILYSHVIAKFCKKLQIVDKKFSEDKIKEQEIIHECFHLIELEIFENSLVKNNVVKGKFLKHEISELSEIAANYFVSLVLGLNYNVNILDYFYLIQTNYISKEKLQTKLKKIQKLLEEDECENIKI